MKKCPYCGQKLDEYFLYENGEATHIKTEDFCHKCKHRVNYYNIRKVKED